MFNKDVFRLLHCKKFPIVNPNDALSTIVAINVVKPIVYPHSVVAHLLSFSSPFMDVPKLIELVCQCVECGWHPYRSDASHYEKICIKKIVGIIDNYDERRNSDCFVQVPTNKESKKNSKPARAKRRIRL